MYSNLHSEADIFYGRTKKNRTVYFQIWRCLSATLVCRSETCCRRFAENTGRKKSPKIRHLRNIAQLCLAISSQLRHISTIGKNVKQQYLSHMSSQYGELRPTSGWDRFISLWHPSKFQRFSCLGFITAATSLNGSQPNFGRCLAVSWTGTLCMHFRRLLPHYGILPPRAKFTSRPSLALSYIGSVAARHSSSGRQSNFAAQRTPPIFGRAAITLGIGPQPYSSLPEVSQCTIVRVTNL